MSWDGVHPEEGSLVSRALVKYWLRFALHREVALGCGCQSVQYSTCIVFARVGTSSIRTLTVILNN